MIKILGGFLYAVLGILAIGAMMTEILIEQLLCLPFVLLAFLAGVETGKKYRE